MQRVVPAPAWATRLILRHGGDRCMKKGNPPPVMHVGDTSDTPDEEYLQTFIENALAWISTFLLLF